ncbi:flagellar type III secretion system pore protein FliP [Actinokineospora inagensis]|uniref:flagellar type III secretion system pore protein FliP n=1 Tax=Actinokineospora inagensis TaxID=103730 RepID=UPI00041FD651|nr:flagellar type III secretion system pore protein FliP [Actinokineospora inagensis]
MTDRHPAVLANTVLTNTVLANTVLVRTDPVSTGPFLPEPRPRVFIPTQRTSPDPVRPPARRDLGRVKKTSVLAMLVVLIGLLGAVGSASAQTEPTSPTSAATQPTGPTGPTGVTVTVGTPSKPSESIVILLLLTTLSVAPSLLLLTTCFTKIFVVLSITRNALGLQNVPPNQVIAGLTLFLSLFIMGPVVSKVNSDGIQPYLNGSKSQSVAFNDGMKPLKEFMLKQTRPEEIALFTKVSGQAKPANADAVPATTLIPAFVLSELRAAMLIGFVLYIPFLVIDMVVSAALMSLGMMMLPPVTVSLPFKLLLFVLANGWGLIITALVGTYS